MSDWQPISTAPKDGTEILAKNGLMRKAVPVYWGIRQHPWGTASQQWVTRSGDLVIPDVWMPLPQPPKEVG